MPTFEKILILRPRFLGDVIQATGLAEIIKKERPQAKVWFLTESPYAELLQSHPKVDGVLSLDVRRKNNPFYLWGLFRILRKQKFDAVLDLFGSPRTARMAFLTGAPSRVGFEHRGRSWAYSLIAKPTTPAWPSGRRLAAEGYRDQARALGFAAEGAYSTSLFTTPEEKDKARQLLTGVNLKPGEKLAAIVPGGSGPAKYWPLDRFVELARRLEAEGIRPFFLFGPKETDLAGELEKKAPKGWLLIRQDRGAIREMIALIEAADLLVSNDTGPMHVGPAVGTPTLGIFGPEDPEDWFAYPAPHEAAYQAVPCSHCGLKQCPLMACMDHLTVDEMFKKALRIIG